MKGVGAGGGKASSRESPFGGSTDITDIQHQCILFFSVTKGYSPSFFADVSCAGFGQITQRTLCEICCTEQYLDGLEGAAEQHVVGGDQSAHGVVMGTDSIDFLERLNVPHLRKMHSWRGNE